MKRLWMGAACMGGVLGIGCALAFGGAGSSASAPKPLWLPGVSLAGAEFAVGMNCEGDVQGSFGGNYGYPTHAEVDYYLSRKMNSFRLPFRWERLEPSLGKAFDPQNLAALKDIVGYISSRGAKSVLDPHNYARYCMGTAAQIIGAPGSNVSAAQFASFWARLAGVFRSDPNVIFALMNEPQSMPTELWRDDAQAAIAAIRGTGAKNLILVPGNAWTGAHSWFETWYGASNASTMIDIKDPGHNLAFEVHQYFDKSFSGTEGHCDSPRSAQDLFTPFTAWLRANKLRGYLGEYAGWVSPACDGFLNDTLSYLDANRDVWIGWAYWAGGPRWGALNEPDSAVLEPLNGQDKPQMKVLSRHLK